MVFGAGGEAVERGRFAAGLATPPVFARFVESRGGSSERGSAWRGAVPGAPRDSQARAGRPWERQGTVRGRVRRRKDELR